jgi:hypothetical protein
VAEKGPNGRGNCEHGMEGVEWFKSGKVIDGPSLSESVSLAVMPVPKANYCTK